MRMEWNENRGLFSGLVLSEPSFSHENHGEDYFRFPLQVERLSGVEDVLPVVVSRSLLEQFPVLAGEKVQVEGEIRSFNNRSGVGAKLVLTVFARIISQAPEGEDRNEVTLSGVLCKMPVYRHTPMGREITDLTLAVNRRYGRSDYLPCITWGGLARMAAELQVADHIQLQGRFQSRNYTKVLENRVVTKTAYEVSAMSLEVLPQREFILTSAGTPD